MYNDFGYLTFEDIKGLGSEEETMIVIKAGVGTKVEVCEQKGQEGYQLYMHGEEQEIQAYVVNREEWQEGNQSEHSLFHMYSY